MIRLYVMAVMMALSMALAMVVGMNTASSSEPPLVLESAAPGWSKSVLGINWRIETSARLPPSTTGKVISSPSFDASSWLPTSMPSTVMATLVANGVYDDPFYSIRLADIPKEQFSVSWWFRTTFDLPNNDPLAAIQTALLRFQGLNYRANIWFNGVQIASERHTAGAFVYFDYDITRLLRAANNCLAVELFEPVDTWYPYNNNTTDLAISFVDWAPWVPDSSMGLWRNVELMTLPSSVSLDYPLVDTQLSWSSPTPTAHLTVMVQVTNHASTPVLGTVYGSINGIGNFSQTVTLKPYQVTQVLFRNSSFSVLNVAKPQLWWPWQMGSPSLHNLTLAFGTHDVSSGATRILDTLTTRFGIRQMSSELDAQQNRLYSVNGQRILIRGAGWAPDLFLRAPRWRIQTEMEYVLHLNLNTIRLEGKMEDDMFFDMADELGILLMPGWCCCDAWQHWYAWQPEQYKIAIESMRTQMRRLRIHPSILVFLYSSDDMPPVELEKIYLQIAAEEYWPNPLLASASNLTSTITGPTGISNFLVLNDLASRFTHRPLLASSSQGVKMSGPYSWEPPNYWYADQRGAAFSFLTEGGPGENPMVLESFQRTIPTEAQWPINFEVRYSHVPTSVPFSRSCTARCIQWDYHTGNQDGTFRNLRFFTPPLNARYGNATSAADYLLKAQAMTYESHRAMFEAYSRNKYTSTGVIQWMLNNAFPQMLWHLYDYYLNTGGAYFGSKIAMEPLHLLYSYDADASIWIVNSLYTPALSLNATADVYLLDSRHVYHQSVVVPEVAPDGTLKVFSLPPIANLTSTYFVRLRLTNATTGATLSLSTYWLSTKQDKLLWVASTGYRTPCSQYADYTALSTLPPVQLDSAIVSQTQRDSSTTVVTVQTRNPSSSTIAFLVRLRLVRVADGQDILPALWDDNYVTLLPGEARTITVTFKTAELRGSKPQLLTEVWNNLINSSSQPSP